MQETAHPTPSVAHRVRTLALIIAGAALFLGVASVIKPPPRSASANVPPAVSPFGAPAPTHPPRTEAAHPKGWKLIGTLEGTQHMVRCWATPDGPRYSVYTLSGQLLQADLPADEVYRAFPDIELENLRADPPAGRSTLMMADTPQD